MNLTIFSRAYTLKKGNRFYFYENDGKYIDEIAKGFKKVYVFTQIIEKKGNKNYFFVSKYTYQFKSNNIQLVNKGGHIQLVFRLLQYINKTHVFLAMGPTIGSYVAALFYLKKTLIIYNGIDFGKSIKSLLGKLEKFILKKSDYILCTGAHLLNKYKNLGMRNIEETMPLLTITEKIVEQYKKEERTEFFNVLSLGHFIDRKDQVTLLKAAELLFDKGLKKIKINYVGSGHINDFKIKNSEVIDKLGSHVKFHGNIQDPKQLFNQFKQNDALCISSLEEGFPRVAYEAMLAKIPIISTPLPGLTSKFENAKDILFYDFRNYLQLANKIELLYNNTELYKSMVDANGKFIREFLKENPSDQFFRIMAKLK